MTTSTSSAVRAALAATNSSVVVSRPGYMRSIRIALNLYSSRAFGRRNPGMRDFPTVYIADRRFSSTLVFFVSVYRALLCSGLTKRRCGTHCAGFDSSIESSECGSHAVAEPSAQLLLDFSSRENSTVSK